MGGWNINWAFGDGGNVEDLIESAAHYHYELCPDEKWRESCVRCKGLHYSAAKDFKPGQACDICDGLGYLKGDGCNEFSDSEMWQYIEDARASAYEDMH